jgi:hypothetical protein
LGVPAGGKSAARGGAYFGMTVRCNEHDEKFSFAAIPVRRNFTSGGFFTSPQTEQSVKSIDIYDLRFRQIKALYKFCFAALF